MGIGRGMGRLVSWQVNGSNVGGWQVMAMSGEGQRVGGSVRLASPHGGVWPGVECVAKGCAVSVGECRGLRAERLDQEGV